MADVGAISNFLQQRLGREGITEVGAVQAAQWLDAAGLLRDSQSRRGKLLRDILRASRNSRAIVGAYQESNRRWKIRRVHVSRQSEQSLPTLQPALARSTNCSFTELIITLADARAASFSGFVSVGSCIETGFPSGDPSSQGGVYLLCAPPGFGPEFISPREARARGNVCFPWPLERLAEKWVEGAEILYIGKSTQLRRPLRQLIRHCQGLVVTHTGGEIIWQLRRHEHLLVCWRPSSDPREMERSLIQGFMQANQGRLPFANRQS